MKVGDTFFFEGEEFSIKNIDTRFSRKFPTGRVDASRFVGSHDDPENPRTIQRGRPKMFEFSVVAEVMGEPIPTPVIPSDIDATDKAGSAWSGLRSDPATVAKTFGKNSTISTSTDW